MLEVKPLTGNIILPGDKSISHRSAMFSVLAKGKSVIENISSGGDVLSTISVLKQLGADINIEENTLTNFPKRRKPNIRLWQLRYFIEIILWVFIWPKPKKYNSYR